MRLMLGTPDAPSLLVDVEQEHSPSHFEFWVVNGAWNGTFRNGYTTVHDCPSGDFSSLEKIEILSDNPDRLRGDYQTVFDNFSNPNYVAPRCEKVTLPPEWDDDIAF